MFQLLLTYIQLNFNVNFLPTDDKVRKLVISLSPRLLLIFSPHYNKIIVDEAMHGVMFLVFETFAQLPVQVFLHETRFA